MIVDTVEGQVITGLVVLIFVVVFLIREWVIQNAALNQEQAIPALVQRLQELQLQGENIEADRNLGGDLVDETDSAGEEPADADVAEIIIGRPEGDSNIRQRPHSGALTNLGEDGNLDDVDESESESRFDDENTDNDVLAESVVNYELADEQRQAPVQFSSHNDIGSSEQPSSSDEGNIGSTAIGINGAVEQENDNVWEDLPDRGVPGAIGRDRDFDDHDLIPPPAEIVHNDLNVEEQVEHDDNNGFWDLAGAWFRENILGDGDAEGEPNALRLRDGFDEAAAIRNNGPEEDMDEEVDDFDGVMELVGMRGPLPVLFQNGIFSMVLVTGTLAVSLWIPYLLGKIVLLILSHPVTFFGVVPVKFISLCANQLVDMAIYAFSSSIIIILHIMKYKPESLDKIYRLLPVSIFKGNYHRTFSEESWARIVHRFNIAHQFIYRQVDKDDMSSTLWKPVWLKLIHGGVAPDRITLIDRIVAVYAGYALFTLIGALYLSHTKRLGRNRTGRAVERIFVDALRQAGAIMKVFIIIGIELVIFPLFCGILLGNCYN